jgi:hypothetical protein
VLKTGEHPCAVGIEDGASHGELRVEPLLYRTLVVTGDPVDGLPLCSVDTLTTVVCAKPALLRSAVRNLFLRGRADLSIFPGLESICVTALAYPTLPNMPLKRVQCNFRDVFKWISSNPDCCSFSTITHLGLFGSVQSVESWTPLAAFPYLTHLTFYDLGIISQCLSILDTYKSLRSLIILRYPGHFTPELAILSDDPRFVMMQVEDYLADWVRGALTGMDYWARADDIIAKRISGEIVSPSLNLRGV